MMSNRLFLSPSHRPIMTDWRDMGPPKTQEDWLGVPSQMFERDHLVHNHNATYICGWLDKFSVLTGSSPKKRWIELRNAFVYVYDEAKRMPEKTTSERETEKGDIPLARQFNMFRCRKVELISPDEFEIHFDGRIHHRGRFERDAKGRKLYYQPYQPMVLKLKAEEPAEAKRWVAALNQRRLLLRQLFAELEFEPSPVDDSLVSVDGSERYYYGVIDLFKKWGKKAAAELRLKITMYEDEASVAKPPDYARRFVRAADIYFQVDEPIVKRKVAPIDTK